MPYAPRTGHGRLATMALLQHDEVVLLLGAPGAGKGTQARFLAERLGAPHVASGDLLRTHRQLGTPLGEQARGYMDRGELVPDDRREVVSKRVEVYLRDTLPVIEHYEQLGLLRRVDGDQPIAVVQEALAAAL